MSEYLAPLARAHAFFVEKITRHFDWNVKQFYDEFARLKLAAEPASCRRCLIADWLNIDAPDPYRATVSGTYAAVVRLEQHSYADFATTTPSIKLSPAMTEIVALFDYGMLPEFVKRGCQVVREHRLQLTDRNRPLYAGWYPPNAKFSNLAI